MLGQLSPFIIWTFRRTGGTNLGSKLFSSSPFKGVEHEPFNNDRIYGNVIKNWHQKKDLDELYQRVDTILAQKPLIKHCLEIMPPALNMAIAAVSHKYGYKHLFLYREYPKDRMLSLNYALKTNIWGKKQAKIITVDDSVFQEDIPIDSLIKHEKMCRRKMSEIYDYLADVAKSTKPRKVSFENLYGQEFEESSKLVEDIFEDFIGSKESITTEFLNSLLNKGGQGTKLDYQRFPNSDKFISKLNDLPPFKL